jgi:heme A synthase
VGSFVFAAHSGFRYVVLATGLLTVLLALMAVVGSGTGARRVANRLYRLWVVLLDVQFLLGVITIFVRPFVPMYIGHVAMMLLAIAFAHVMSKQSQKAGPDGNPRLVLAGAALSLGLIVGGILSIGRPIV